MNITPFYSNRRGFTLAEVMVAAASASIVMVGLVGVYLATTKVASSGLAQLGVQAKARQGLDTILYDVRRSQSAIIYSTYNGDATFTGNTNSDAGAYMIFNIPTNTIAVGDQQYHHYYVGNLRDLGNGVTNGTLYYFNCASDTNIATKSTDVEVVRGVTNPDRVFDWINGVVNVNIRIADENDVDGKQIIYLRSAVAFRNGD